MNEQPPHGTDPDADESESRAALVPFAASLGSAAVWSDPPDALEALVLDRVRAATATDPVVPETSRSRVGVAIARRVLPAVAAAVIAFSIGFAIANRSDDDVDAMADVQLAGTELAPSASATGNVVDRGAGYAIRLDMDGLPPAPDGSYYEGWLRADDGEMVSVGTFHMRGGDGSVVLWSGVRVAEYSTLVVTEQMERSPGDPHDRVVLEGQIETR